MSNLQLIEIISKAFFYTLILYFTNATREKDNSNVNVATYCYGDICQKIKCQHNAWVESRVVTRYEIFTGKGTTNHTLVY